jgi:hypothetical protein
MRSGLANLRLKKSATSQICDRKICDLANLRVKKSATSQICDLANREVVSQRTGALVIARVLTANL